jgi:hypothetical protein
VTTSAFILSFIRGMESFESAVFFGTPVGINVITTQIYNSITQRAQPDYQSATALGFAAMALMFLLLVLQGRLLGGRSFTTVTGKAYSPNVTRLGWMRSRPSPSRPFSRSPWRCRSASCCSAPSSSSSASPGRHADFRPLPMSGRMANSGGPSQHHAVGLIQRHGRWCWAASWPTITTRTRWRTDADRMLAWLPG